MELKKGVVFSGKYFTGRVEVIEVNEEKNELHVCLTQKNETSFSIWAEIWDLNIVRIGFETGDYFKKEFTEDYPPLMNQ